MNIVWFSWKDIKHPQAGGAETVSHNIMKRLVLDGHKVKLITAIYADAEQNDVIDGIEVYRSGGRLTVYWHAFRYFQKNLKDWPELVVDEMNTIPFGAAFYTKKRSVLLSYQLARSVWFYQMPFPISVVGYILEPFYLFALSRKYKTVVTESESTKKDMRKYGFAPSKVHVFRVGMHLKPVSKLPTKTDLNTVLSLGAVRPMKRTLHAVKAFEQAHSQNSELQLVIAGDTNGSYGQKVTRYIGNSPHKSAIKILGRVSNEERMKLMKQAGLIIVTSIKEGWGLIVTEAASQGTPAVVYDTDGLRDSVINGKTGVTVPNSHPKALGNAIVSTLQDSKKYQELRHDAWEHSKQFTFETSYDDFCKALKV